MIACLGLGDAARGLILTGAACLIAQCVALAKHERQRRVESERAQVRDLARRHGAT